MGGKKLYLTIRHSHLQDMLADKEKHGNTLLNLLLYTIIHNKRRQQINVKLSN